MRHLVAISAIGCALAAGASAQNILQNGDFEAATLAPWSAQQFAINPALEDFNTDGTRVSQAYSATPGYPAVGQTFHSIEQTVDVVGGTTYELQVDVAGVERTPMGSDPYYVHLSVDSLSGSTIATGILGFSSQPAHNPMLRKMRARFVAPMSEPVKVRFIFEVRYVAVPSAGYRFYLDNVDLRPSRDPWLTAWSNKYLGESSSLGVRGSAGVPYAIFVAPATVSPITIPGFTGQLALDPSSFAVIFNSVFDAQGRSGISFTIPNLPSLSGVPLYWQAAQANVILGVADLGWETMEAFVQ